MKRAHDAVAEAEWLKDCPVDRRHVHRFLDWLAARGLVISEAQTCAAAAHGWDHVAAFEPLVSRRGAIDGVACVRCTPTCPCCGVPCSDLVEVDPQDEVPHAELCYRCHMMAAEHCWHRWPAKCPACGHGLLSTADPCVYCTHTVASTAAPPSKKGAGTGTGDAKKRK